jgi:hypothetical protein
LRAIESAERRGDIGQQCCRNQITADKPDQARKQRERHQLEYHHAVQHPRRHAARAQGTQGWQALLKGEPDRGIDDEKTDKERQQTECGQVQMKTVGEPFEIALRIGRDKAQFVAGNTFQRLTFAFGFANQQARKLPRHFQQILRDADIDDQHAGHQLRLHAKRWQDHAAIGRRCRALGELEVGKRLRRHQHLSRRRHEGLQIGCFDCGRVADLTRQRDRLDAEQAERTPADLDAAFEHGRYRPAGAAQVDEELLRKGGAVLADQHGRSRPAEGGGGAIVGNAGLQVECLHAAPQRGCRDQSDQ